MLSFILHKGHKIQFSSYCQDIPSCFDKGNLLRRTSYNVSAMLVAQMHPQGSTLQGEKGSVF